MPNHHQPPAFLSEEKRDDQGRFIVPPVSPGRPKGARSKLGEAFLKAMLEDFDRNGIVAIEKAREDKPDQYLKVIASLLPKEITGEDGEPIAFVGKIVLEGVRPGADS